MSQATREYLSRFSKQDCRSPGFASTAQPNSSRQKVAARLKANVVNLKTAAVVFRFLALSARDRQRGRSAPDHCNRDRLLFRRKRKREMDQGCPSDKIDWQEDSLPGFTV